jgi:hypothetical protein
VSAASRAVKILRKNRREHTVSKIYRNVHMHACHADCLCRGSIFTMLYMMWCEYTVYY